MKVELSIIAMAVMWVDCLLFETTIALQPYRHNTDIDTESEVVAVGDSWSELGAPVLEQIFEVNGLNWTVGNYGKGGTTTSDWAKNPNEVRNDVAKNSKRAKFVWMSLGGNDAQDIMPDCTKVHSIDYCIERVTSIAINNTYSILDSLFDSYPNISVVQFGYDLPNFSENFDCVAKGTLMIDQCKDDTYCINSEMIKLQYSYVDYIAQSGRYTAEQYTSVDLLGSLQAWENYPNASVGEPNLNEWSPRDLMLNNCVHPNTNGFTILMSHLYDQFFGKFVHN